jgi:hypothetical protein
MPLDKMPEKYRESVRQVMDNPTLFARGPKESFVSKPEVYQWLLDHPDRGVLAWRRLGAQCVSIVPSENGIYNWSDNNGSEVNWETVLRENGLHVWYAYGKVRPGPMLPMVPVRVVVVLRYLDKSSADGAPVLQHQADVYLHTDSKTATFIARMLGSSSTKLAEQGLAQMQLFFSGLSWYLFQNPAQTETLLRAGN